jgi:hypothetical protein
MSSEIIQSVQSMIIMMIFNMSTSYFHKISFHYFEDYFTDKTLSSGKVCKWKSIALTVHIFNELCATTQLDGQNRCNLHMGTLMHISTGHRDSKFSIGWCWEPCVNRSWFICLMQRWSQSIPTIFVVVVVSCSYLCKTRYSRIVLTNQTNHRSQCSRVHATLGIRYLL